MVTKRIKRRLDNDLGAAITIMSLAIFVLIMILAIFIVDFTHATSVRNHYEQMNQRAAHTALKEQNAIGGLTPLAAEVAVDEYLSQRDGKRTAKELLNDANTHQTSTVESGAFRSYCSEKYKEYPEITVEFSTDRQNAGKGSKGFTEKFTYQTIKDKDGKTVGGKWLGDNPSTFNGISFYQNNYRTIKVTTKDFGDNHFMGMAGKPCTVYTVTSTAIAIDADAGNTGK